MIGCYRIYPAWFHGSASSGMRELAQLEARSLGLVVTVIEIVGQGNNDRGHYIDFNVLYTKTGALEKSS